MSGSASSVAAGAGAGAGAGVGAQAPCVIVCAYPDGALANPWFRAYKRLKEVAKRAELNALVDLRPITDLPPRVDVLVAPPSLAEVASTAPGVQEWLIRPAEGLQGELDRLVERLVQEGRLRSAPPRARARAVHQGFQAVTERAVADRGDRTSR